MKSDEVSEAFLEMFFARPLADLFAQTFGARFLRLLKPTPNLEAYLGFDQGWVRHTVPPQQFEKALRAAIANRATQLNVMRIGYFMQFKRVIRMKMASKYTPAPIVGEHYRVELDLSPNEVTGLCQHETLIRLSRIAGADVSYACGMVFDSHAIYADASLDDLRIVPVDGTVATKYATWNPGERHFLTFESPAADPIWCSDPFQGHARRADTWAATLRERSPDDLLAMMTKARQELRLPEDAAIPYLMVVELARD